MKERIEKRFLELRDEGRRRLHIMLAGLSESVDVKEEELRMHGVINDFFIRKLAELSIRVEDLEAGRRTQK